ncbi:response regulator transcription factor [Ilyobacter polytropus]|uniref:Two component transcriptional regulator, winged helix family n=1 Tax=Ilyobacter polytropus (strain ATCC 51220 / DSM 2926 / LMG 16218 / CuHBu1) TaxID=572544 RepID=E3H842_ILYPC|nr:response regulator transcription factor [Ilyobacter polytropus]ADO83273.1 two component transcriptional regulator, winged helix family [Ilyobacter polytropus DSM 2926]
MKKILVVEDEWKMRRLIKDYLVKEGYHVDEAGDGMQALEMFQEGGYDLVILDIMLPKMDGWSVCREIRRESMVPVIMLTARSEENDQIFGFELEADEYITKPFNPRLLVARIKAIFRRAGKPDKISRGDIEIDEGSRKVEIKGEAVELTSKEFEMLLYFVQNRGIALSREKILNSVWGWDYFGDVRTVDTHVKRLRKKIGEIYIQTIRGFGYRFEEG